MCGRFVSAQAPDQVAAYFGAVLDETLLAPNYNVAPTNDIYAVVLRPDGRHLTTFHWGLIPSWAKDAKIGMKMINARSETVLEKNVFKSPLKKKRCIIPMDGFYEWKAPGPGAPLGPKGKPVKQPLFIHRADGEPLAIAGVWESWAPPAAAEGERLYSATLFTTAANEDMAPVHDRMPVILPASAWDKCLDPENNDLELLSGLLLPAPKGLLAMHEVSTDVNNVRNKGQHLIDPVAAVAPSSLF